jgi:hypothetical protein
MKFCARGKRAVLAQLQDLTGAQHNETQRHKTGPIQIS